MYVTGTTKCFRMLITGEYNVCIIERLLFYSRLLDMYSVSSHAKHVPNT